MGFIKKGVESVFDFAGDLVGDLVGGITGKTAAEAAREASATAAAAQTEGLEFLKEQQALPAAIKEQALTQLQDIYMGGEGQAAAIERAKASPLYSALLEGGEDAALRARAATGGLRSGGAISDVQDVRNRALMQAYQEQVGGIGGLAGLQTDPGMIAQMIGNIGGTEAAGITGAARAEQEGMANVLDLALKAAPAVVGFFSDIRLKDNIRYETSINDVSIYTWDWNKHAKDLGLDGLGIGPLAQEVEKDHPEMVVDHKGFKVILTEPFARVING